MNDSGRESDNKNSKRNLYLAVSVISVVAILASYFLASNLSKPTVNVGDNVVKSVSPEISSTALSGNLTIYIVPVNLTSISSSDVVDKISMILDGMVAGNYTSLGASLQGQYGDERIAITEDNIPLEGKKKGDVVTHTVIKKPADTVKVYIDPEVRKYDGSPVRVSDINENMSFGNGVTCCGVALKDGTDLRAAFFVVDQAYDQIMMQKLSDIKRSVG